MDTLNYNLENIYKQTWKFQPKQNNFLVWIDFDLNKMIENNFKKCNDPILDILGSKNNPSHFIKINLIKSLRSVKHPFDYMCEEWMKYCEVYMDFEWEWDYIFSLADEYHTNPLNMVSEPLVHRSVFDSKPKLVSETVQLNQKGDKSFINKMIKDYNGLDFTTPHLELQDA